MGLFGSLSGLVSVELTSADISASLRQINEDRIPIKHVRLFDDLTASFTISRRYLNRIRKMADRKGERLIVRAYKGLYWNLYSLLQRPVLLAGLSFLFLMSLFLPTRILVVEIEGNDMLTNNLILETAHDAGIRFGASRRDVRSEKVKNELLGALPQLQWAGVNTYGCRAVISVRERELEREHLPGYTFSNVVSACDGVVTSITVTSGTGMCNAGQAIRKGQLLISGYMDCGGVIAEQRATGEIFAQTRHEISVITPSECELRVASDGIQTNYSLSIGKKRINFYKGSGISDSSCVKMVTQYYFTLPGGYKLPLALIKEQKVFYQTKPHEIETEQSAYRLSEFSQKLLRSESVALTIVDKQEMIEAADGVVKLYGVYSCSEMVGREQIELTGDSHDKTN